jgi:enoyl-CoA hydratase/carnithine racemase
MPPASRESRVEIFKEQGGRIARLVLTAPPDNALDLPMVDSLMKAVEAVNLWPDKRAVVIEGFGPDFSLGHPKLQLRPPFAAALIQGFQGAVHDLLRMDVLIVSAVRGRCEGAGAALALAADVVLSDKTTRFQFKDAVGLLPPLVSAFITHRLRREWAASTLLSTEAMTSERAGEIGLVSRDAGGWEEVGPIADRVVERLALKPTQGAVEEAARALHSPVLSHTLQVLPELEKRALEKLGRRVDEEVTAPTKWRPG